MNDEKQSCDLREMIKAARGELRVDLLLTNASVVNVLSKEIIPGESIAIHGDRIVGFGLYEAEQVIDLKGKTVAPGFIDGHMHIESSMVSPFEFARAIVPLGTTTVVVDPHEIANVKGKAGIQYILQANESVPLDIYVMLPSCVPATPMETNGATLSADDLREFVGERMVPGLAELMNFPGTIMGDPSIMEKLALVRGKIVDGHSPLLSGKDLSAYILAGPSSDHECTRLEEAQEKLRKGMCIMIREGTFAKNLEALIPLVTPENHNRFLLVTDDREPLDLKKEGHLNFLIKKAIHLGLNPVIALSMVSINAAQYFRLDRTGAIAPGYKADLTVIDNLNDFNIEMVFKGGKLAARAGKPLFTIHSSDDSAVRNTVKIAPLDISHFRIEARSKLIRCIGVVPNQIITQNLIEEATIQDGFAVADREKRLAKMAVIARYGEGAHMGLGFIRDLGLTGGALAMTIAHDSHNIVVAGMNDDDMKKAVDEIVRLQGGIVIVKDGETLGELPLPIGGLMSADSFQEVTGHIEILEKAARQIGFEGAQSLMTLSFMALPVIPDLKITDRGLVDVNTFQVVELFL